MGYNTTVVVVNDALGDIEKDPKFGERLVAAILELSLNRHGIHGVDVPAYIYNEKGEIRGAFSNAAMAIESHHADLTTVLAIGGNCASILTSVVGSHHTDEDKVNILRKLAHELGYDIRKKPVCKYHGKEKN